jgi:DNA repair exonuclease SbcCD nuclease subunit
LTKICRLAADHDVAALTCGGDMYENDRFTPDTAEFLRATFADLHPLPVFLAPGNHDWFGPRSLYRQVNWSPNVHLFTTTTLTPVPIADGLTLWGAGHRAPANTPNFLDGFRADRRGVHIALFHGSEQRSFALQGEGKVPHAPFRAEQIADAGLAHALLGHFHTPTEAPTHTYPGNPDPLTFGETGRRGAVLLEVAGDGTVSRERFAVASSEVHDVTVDLSGVTHSDEVIGRVRDAVAILSGVARVTLTGEVEPDVDLRLQDIASARPAHLDALLPRLVGVRVAYDVDHLSQEPTVRGQFVRDVLADTTLSDDQRRKVLITGLRSLDGRRNELEVH